MSDFASGALFWLKGWAFILRHRSLLVLTLIPFLLALVGCFTSVYLLITYFPAWLRSSLALWLDQATVSHDLVYYVLLVAAGVVSFFLLIYFFIALQAVLALPFLSCLAERTLKLTGKYAHRYDVNFWRLLVAACAKAFLFVVAGLILFLFSFVFGVNFIVGYSVLLLMAFDCLNYSFEILGWPLKPRLKYLRRFPAQWLGMATGLALTLIIPGFTLFVFPGAVVGAALILKNQESKP